MNYKYKVSKQYLRGSETQFAAFTDLDDAKAFVELKLESDANLNVKVTYRILELGEVIAQFEPGGAQKSSESQGAQGKGSTATFKPTPFNTAPRPSGIPSSWTKDEDEKGGNKK